MRCVEHSVISEQARASYAAVQLARELSLFFFLFLRSNALYTLFDVFSLGPRLVGVKLVDAYQFVSAILCGARFGHSHQRNAT